MAKFSLAPETASRSPSWAGWQGLVWALLSCAVALALSLAVPMLRESNPYLLFLAAVVLSAWRWGNVPGIAATAVSLFAIAEILSSHYPGRHLPLSDFVRLCVFADVCIVVIVLGQKRREAEQKLRASERYFRAIIEHTSDVITIVDRRGIVRYASPPVRHLLGCEPHEILGKSFLELVHPGDQRRAADFLQVSLTSQAVLPVELRLLCRDGSFRLVESAARVLQEDTDTRRDPQAAAGDVVIASRDITERTRAADSFRALLESAPDGFVGATTQGVITVVNTQAERMFGYTREELLGQSIEILVPARLRSRHLEHRANYEKDPRVRPMGARGVDLVARRKDGTEFPVEISLSPIRTDGGMLIASIIRDVTERRKAEAQKAELIREQSARVEAEAAQRRFYELVQDLDAIVWELDLTLGRLTFVSRRATELLGYPPEHWLAEGDAWLEHIEPEDRARVREFMQNVAAGGPPWLEYRARSAEGRQLWLRLSVYVVRDQRNQPKQLRGLTVDVTERKQAEEALRTNEKLAATGRLAASIAHEINNPMGAVTNLLYLIETDAGADEQIRHYARLGQEEMNRVAHITRQMLAFYRDSTAPAQVDIAEVMNATLELYGLRIREAGIRLERRFQQVPPIRAFPGEMRQVFSNLLLNAVEATGNNGRIQVKVARSRDWSNLQRTGIRITFNDNGSGIRPGDRQHIFEPFFTTKGENGTGLGLWVSLGIVRKHGGSIRVRSSVRPGKSGTSFSIFLPFDTALVSSTNVLTMQNRAKAANSRAS
jgi:PAS domain S-box-containing protein